MTDFKVHLCFECGQKNRIAVGKEAGAKCGSCGSAIYSTNQKSRTTPSKAKAPPPASLERPKSGDNGLAWLIAWSAGITIFIVVLNWAYTASNGVENRTDTASGGRFTLVPDEEATKSTRASLAGARAAGTDRWEPPVESPVISLPMPDPQPFAPGVVWNRTGRESIAPFSLRTSSGSNYFIKLVDARTGADAVAFMVKGGQYFEVDVPVGDYKMRYATGTIWYGEDLLFGSESTNYYQADAVMDFYIEGNQVSGHEVELILQANGNLRTDKIAPGRF
ncbi:hypothetical protein [Sneathiella sp.]|uniref:hypothetical protein n=1 Tax=Sneathiella sp. TaxID=1964365 RepID=UPI0035628419